MNDVKSDLGGERMVTWLLRWWHYWHTFQPRAREIFPDKEARAWLDGFLRRVQNKQKEMLANGQEDAAAELPNIPPECL